MHLQNKMVAQKSLDLKWDGFEANLKDALKAMREEEMFFDVTLVAGDGKQVKTSKVILARGSSFFHQILRENAHVNPHIYLMGVPYKHLQSLLDFLYTGQASITQEDVVQFLYIADDLKIEGLILPDQPIPKTLTPLQNHISLEDHTPPPKTISAAFKDHVAAEEQATQNRGYSSQTLFYAEKYAIKIEDLYQLEQFWEPNTAEKIAQKRRFHPNAPHQHQVVTGGQDTRKNKSSPQHQDPSKDHSQSNTISPSTETTPVLQGQFSADVRKLGQQLVHKAPPLGKNTFPNPKRQDDTGIVKVEVPVGDANDYNVHYATNDQGEQYISSVSKRVFQNSEKNYQDVSRQNQAMDQDDNRKMPKEEPIDTRDTSDIVYSKAVGSEAEHEETVHDLYDVGEENGCKIPVGEKQNQNIKNCSVRLFRMEIKRYNMVSSKYDNIKETVNEESTQDNSEPVEDIGEDVVQDIDNEGDNGFQCHFCVKLFRCASQLKMHEMSHTGEKPFQCSQCHKSFSQMGNLKTHMRSHTGDKPFQCSHCPKSFSMSSNLKTHMRSHTGEKPFQCSHCPKSFSLSGNLKKHMRSHTGEKPFQCSQCPKRFSQLGNLDVHMRIHNGEKPFKCNICSKRFSQQYHLTTHKMIHTGEKPYKCFICTKNFRSSSELAKHKKRKGCSS